jgi:hypothetical protein
MNYALLLTLGLVFMALVLSGGNAAADAPRQTLSLDGEWQIAFDHNNAGSGQWHREEVFQGLASRAITVPSCWEEIEQDYEGAAFYGHHFSVAPSWKGKAVRLEFDAVNYVAEVWLNGEVAGHHEGGYGPFEFRVDDLLHYDKENFLSVRVIGPIVAQDKVIDGIGRSDMPHWRGAIVGGIWQSVRLTATGTAFVEDVFVEPRLEDDTATVHLTMENTAYVGRKVDVHISIRSAASPEAIVASEEVALDLIPGKNEGYWTLNLPDAVYWSPASPHLYVANISISDDGVVSDNHSVQFGMRELTIRDQDFYLNGKPIFIKAAFFEGLYPTRLANPDSPEMARREIQLAKDAGFNMIRPWRKPPPPMWLDLCDEMGMMVVGGLPIECMKRWPSITPRIRQRVEHEVRSAVLRDRNRACIVQWEMFNEIHRPGLKRLKHPASMLARSLDPTRLVLDESGGFAGGANIYLPYQFEPIKFNDVHTYPGAPLNAVGYDKLLALSKTAEEIKALKLRVNFSSGSHTAPGLMTVVSEIGYGSLPDLVDNNERFAKEGNPLVPPYRYHKMLAESFLSVLKESGFDTVYPDLQQFCLDQQARHATANKRMVEAARMNPDVDGYAVHALTGGDWVIGAGLIDLFRNPKKAYWAMKEVNQERYLAIRILPRNVYADKGTTLAIGGLNELEDLQGELTIAVQSATGEEVFKTTIDLSLKQGIHDLFEHQLDTTTLEGTYTVEARLTAANGTVITRNSDNFDVFSAKQLETPKTKIALLDTNNSLRSFLDASGVAYEKFSENTDSSTPVLVTQLQANSPEARADFKNLLVLVEKGGTAVYLNVLPPGFNPWVSRPMDNTELLPLTATFKHGMGLWVGVSHIVKEHPVFAGLPTNTMMDQIYENVWTNVHLKDLQLNKVPILDLGSDLIAGAVTHGFWATGREDQQGYLGPEPAWWGTEVAAVPYGKGRLIISTLRLLDHLGKDPVADKILVNVLHWLTEGT